MLKLTYYFLYFSLFPVRKNISYVNQKLFIIIFTYLNINKIWGETFNL